MEMDVAQLEKSFGQKNVLSNLHFKFHQGQFVNVQGANGAGKTTLLKVLSGVLKPDVGEVRLNGVDLHKNIKKFKGQIRWVPATERGLFMFLSGKDNLDFFRRINNIDERSYSQALEQWSSTPLFLSGYNTSFHNCSTAMRQILRLFLAFLGRPRLVFLDEPFRSFHAHTLSQVLPLMDDFCNENDAIVFVSTPTPITLVSGLHRVKVIEL